MCCRPPNHGYLIHISRDVRFIFEIVAYIDKKNLALTAVSLGYKITLRVPQLYCHKSNGWFSTMKISIILS